MSDSKCFLMRGYKNSATDDCDNFTTGVYFVFGSCQNMPEQNSCLILSFSEGTSKVGDKFQIAITRSRKLCIRSSSTSTGWLAWREFAPLG